MQLVPKLNGRFSRFDRWHTLGDIFDRPYAWTGSQLVQQSLEVVAARSVDPDFQGRVRAALIALSYQRADRLSFCILQDAARTMSELFCGIIAGQNTELPESDSELIEAITGVWDRVAPRWDAIS